MESVALGHGLGHTGIGLAKHGLVKRLAETLGGFLYLLVDFLVIFGELVLDEDIGAVTLLGVAVVNQGVVESVDMARCFPDCRVHENRGVDADDILMEEGHGLPPVAFDVVFELYAVLAVVVNG